MLPTPAALALDSRDNSSQGRIPSEEIVAVIDGMSLETATSPQLQDACQPSLVALTRNPFDGTMLTEVLGFPLTASCLSSFLWEQVDA